MKKSVCLSKKDQKRIQYLENLLMEMVRGNFSYQLKRSQQTDTIEAITALLNMINEELHSYIEQDSFQNSNSRFIVIAKGSFFLNHSFHIQNFSKGIPELLGHSPLQLKGKNFTQLLTESSKIRWYEIIKQVYNSPKQDLTIPLAFHTHHSMALTQSCSVQMLISKEDDINELIVTLLDVIHKDKLHHISKDIYRYEITSSVAIEDKEKIQLARKYLKANVDGNPISLRALALFVGTNEFKLKKGFKLLFATTVYQYQKELRLKKASFYLTTTHLPIKVIAKKLGYKTPPHFSRVFKEYFGVSPIIYRKQPPQHPNNPE